MTPSQIQNALVLMLIVGFASLEVVTRRYRDTEG